MSDVRQRQKSEWANIYSCKKSEKIMKWPDEYVVRIMQKKWRADAGMHRMLDFGCGAGRHALFFAMNGITAHGIDFDKNAVEIAQEQAKERDLDVSFRCTSMLDTGYDDGFFDAVVAWRSIHELPYDDMPLAAQEIRRILRPGGHLLVSCGSKGSVISPAEKRHRFVLSLDELKELFSDMKILNIEQNIFTYNNRKIRNEYWIMEATAP
jgi:2-polyprenyl-3-methyl-5-hydroxy-6-metoxy-1,4-benzoquinol methylase